MKIERLISPDIFPVSLVDVKNQLRILNNDEDQSLTLLLRSAIRQAEDYTGRPLVEQRLRLKYDAVCDVIKLCAGPIISIDRVEYFDQDNVLQSLDLAVLDVDLEGEVLKPYSSWPSMYPRFNKLRIEVTAGYSIDQFPVPIKIAVLLMVGHLYENREASTAVNQSEIEFGFKSLLDPYRKVAV